MAVATQSKKKLMRFRILAGKHRTGQRGLSIERHGVDRPDTIKIYAAKIPTMVKDEDGNEYEELRTPKGFDEDSDIIETMVDLAMKFNVGTNPQHKKFERLADPEQPGELEADEDAEELNEMSVKGLREFAEASEIDLDGATLKQEIINHILAARAEA